MKVRSFYRLTIIFSILLVLANIAFSQHPEPDKQKEHVAAMFLFSDDMITHTVINSGLWSETSTWENGLLPTVNAVISVPINLRLEVDLNSDLAFRAIRVDGNLYFSPERNVKLVVETIIVRPSGSFQIASEEQRLDTDKLIQINFPTTGAIDRNWDTEQMSRGMVLHGKTRIFGAKKQAFYKIISGATQGSNTVQLNEVASNWRVGDTVVIAGTNELGWNWKTNVGHTYYGTEDEERVITAISDKTLTLNSALKFNHLPIHSGMPIYIANYTRNISFKTMNVENLPFNQRAHIMFMHSPNAIVKGAGFYDLGRTDKSKPMDDLKLENPLDRHSALLRDQNGTPLPGLGNNIRGRYAVHFHRSGGTKSGSMPTICEGNAVMRSPGWGFVSHESNVIMHNNASYDVFGAHFVSEDGNELGEFSANIAIKAKGSHAGHKEGTNSHDLGHTGNGFWLESRNILVKDNVAAGMSDSGIHFFHRHGLISPRVAIDDLIVKEKDIGVGASELSYNSAVIEAFNNTVVASAKAIHVTKAGPNQGHQLRNIFDGLYAYNVITAVHLEYTSKYTIRNFAIYADPINENFQNSAEGILLRNNTQDVALQNGMIHGFKIGISAGKNFDSLDTSDTLIVNVSNSKNTTFIQTVDTSTDKVVENDPNQIIILNNNDLVPGRLNFTPTNTLNILQPTLGHWWNETTVIAGTLTDSAGNKEIKLQIPNRYLRDVMIPKGYFIRENGSKYVLVKHHIADRVTGETAVVMSTFELPINTNSPNLGSTPKLPTFTESPIATEGNLGSPLTFNCKGTVAGYYYVHYQWQKNGVDIPGAHYPNFTIHRLSTSDLGDKYTCKISSLAGSVTSKEALVYTKRPKAPSNLRIKTSGASQFKISAQIQQAENNDESGYEIERKQYICNPGLVE